MAEVVDSLVTLVRALFLVAFLAGFVILYLHATSRNSEPAAADGAKERVSSQDKPKQNKRRRRKRPSHANLPDLPDEPAPADENSGSILQPAHPLGFSAEFVKLGKPALLPKEAGIPGKVLRDVPIERIGSKIEARWQGGSEWFPGRIAQQHYDGSYMIEYEDGEKEIKVSPSFIRLRGSTITLAEEDSIPQPAITAPTAGISLPAPVTRPYFAGSGIAQPRAKSYLAVAEDDTAEEEDDDDSCEDAPNAATRYEGQGYEYEVMQDDDDDWQMVSHRPAKTPQQREQQREEKTTNLKNRNKRLKKKNKERLVTEMMRASA